MRAENKGSITSVAGTCCLIHATAIALQWVLLIQLWWNADGAPPLVEQLAVGVVSGVMILTDLAVGAANLRLAIWRRSTRSMTLVIPCAVYIVALLLSWVVALKTTPEFFGRWVLELWPWHLGGIAICSVGAGIAIANDRRVNRADATSA